MASRKRNREDYDSEKSFLQVLLSPVEAVREWFADALGGNDSIKTNDSSFTSFVSILTFPFRLLFAIAVFMVQAWSTSRVGRAFVLGLPAVFTVFACLSVAWVSTRYYNAISVGRTAGYYALHATNPEAPPENALMFARKLVSLKPEDPKGLFKLGLSLASNDDWPGAIGVMNTLAPPELPAHLAKDRSEPNPKDPAPEKTLDKEEDKIGDYLPAHLWLSQYYQKQLLDEGFTPQADFLAEKHLSRAADKDPENKQLAISLGSLYELRANRIKDTDSDEYLVQMRNLESSLSDAIKPPLQSLQQVAQIPRLIRIKRQLAELDETVNFEQSKKEFERLFDELLKLGQKQPDNIRLNILGHVISGYVQLKEYDKAVNMIKVSLPSFDSAEVKEKLIKTAGIVSLENAGNNSDLDDKDQYTLRLTSICDCLNSSFRDRRAYQMLLGFIRHNQIHPEKFEWLQDTLLKSPKLAVNHIMIGCHLIHAGIKAGDQDKIRQGTSHWKIAYKVEPRAQFMLNNILEIGISYDPLPLESVDEMIRQAVTMFPDQNLLHQSAGLLSISKNNFEEAITSLETAATTDRFPVIPHLLLKHCHESIGNSFKALNHNKSAEELLAKLSLREQEQIGSHVKLLIEKTTNKGPQVEDVGN